jgi:uncharacterized membrane protein YhaH (DUF805 family)
MSMFLTHLYLNFLFFPKVSMFTTQLKDLKKSSLVYILYTFLARVVVLATVLVLLS